MNDNVFTIEIIIGLILVFLDFFLLKTPGFQAAFFGTFIVVFSAMIGFAYLACQTLEPYKTKKKRRRRE